MNGSTKQLWLFAAGGAVLGGYLVVWGWAGWVGSYPAVLALVRAGLITLALMGVAVAVWWARNVKKFTVRSLVLGGPLVVAIAVVPLPYYSHGRSVQLSLQKAGLQYRVQAEGFSRTLQQISCELLGLDAPNLFAARLTFLRIDLASARQDQLHELGYHPELQVVTIIKSSDDQQLAHSTIQWINSLPTQTRVTLSLYKMSKQDAEQLKSIRHSLHEINIYGDGKSTTDVWEVLKCQPENVYFSEVAFPADFSDPLPAASKLALPTVRLNRCQLTGAQLVKLAEVSSCSTLNCDHLTTQPSVDECRQLASLPGLKNLLLGTTALSFEQLQPLMTSQQLESFMAVAARSVSKAELEQLRASVPAGANRRLRVDYGWGIAVGDVGLGRRSN